MAIVAGVCVAEITVLVHVPQTSMFPAPPVTLSNVPKNVTVDVPAVHAANVIAELFVFDPAAAALIDAFAIAALPYPV